jgi:hypothetical protein
MWAALVTITGVLIALSQLGILGHLAKTLDFIDKFIAFMEEYDAEEISTPQPPEPPSRNPGPITGPFPTSPGNTTDTNIEGNTSGSGNSLEGNNSEGGNSTVDIGDINNGDNQDSSSRPVVVVVPSQTAQGLQPGTVETLPPVRSTEPISDIPQTTPTKRPDSKQVELPVSQERTVSQQTVEREIILSRVNGITQACVNTPAPPNQVVFHAWVDGEGVEDRPLPMNYTSNPSCLYQLDLPAGSRGGTLKASTDLSNDDWYNIDDYSVRAGRNCQEVVTIKDGVIAHSTSPSSAYINTSDPYNDEDNKWGWVCQS